MNLDGELNQSLEVHLSDCPHSSESTHFMRLHLEQDFVRTIYASVQAFNTAPDLEYECYWRRDSRIDDEDLIHQEHVDDEDWGNGAPGSCHQN